MEQGAYTGESDEVQLFELSQLSEANRRWLGVLVQNESDMSEFVELLGKSRNYGEAVADFHTLKIDRSHITKEQFAEQYRDNAVYALQSLFMYPVDVSVVMMLDEQLHNGKWTLEGLYDAHCAHPYRNIYRFIL